MYNRATAAATTILPASRRTSWRLLKATPSHPLTTPTAAAYWTGLDGLDGFDKNQINGFQISRERDSFINQRTVIEIYLDDADDAIPSYCFKAVTDVVVCGNYFQGTEETVDVGLLGFKGNLSGPDIWLS